MTSLTEVEKMTAGVRRCGVIVDVRACVSVNIAGEYRKRCCKDADIYTSQSIS